MANEVIYLGFKINIHGISPVKEKIDSIKKAKEPQNVSELKSFLGLLNYYHRHFKEFADILGTFAYTFEKRREMGMDN